jgi:hypothetical protein
MISPTCSSSWKQFQHYQEFMSVESMQKSYVTINLGQCYFRTTFDSSALFGMEISKDE